MDPIQLVKIENVNFSINNEYNYDTFDNNFKTHFQNELNISDSILSIELTVNIKDSNDKILSSITMLYEFKGNFKKEFISSENEKKTLILNVMNIAMGCTRGVIFAKTINHKILSKYIMPLIPTDIILKKIIIEDNPK